jgi:TonB-dependent starch-binding outer membrane protein SusC
MSRQTVFPRLLGLTAAALLAACASGGAKSSKGTNGASPSRGPTTTVTSSDLEQNPNTPIEQVLRGRIAGVTVSRAEDGGLVIRVRGSTSFNSSDAPLYVVDGVPLQPSPSGSLQGINPYDIESIKVLKDPASLTMYGSRGANGVVLIKTKAPGRR